jgi:Ca2+-binding EF-hand superfamily protein
MKTPIYALAMAVLLGGHAMAGDSPRSDAPHDTLRADTDGDGRVSRAEAEAASSKKSTEWFEKLDTNKDGYVTQDEISQAKATRRADMKARFDERFQEADANNDGQLSLDEVQAKLPRLADRFTTLDKDKNGMLSREELANGGPHHRRPEPQN